MQSTMTQRANTINWNAQFNQIFEADDLKNLDEEVADTEKLVDKLYKKLRLKLRLMFKTSQDITIDDNDTLEGGENSLNNAVQIEFDN